MYNPTYILQKHFKPPTKLFSDENQCTKSVLVLKGSGSEWDFFTAIQEFYLNGKISVYCSSILIDSEKVLHIYLVFPGFSLKVKSTHINGLERENKNNSAL